MKKKRNIRRVPVAPRATSTAPVVTATAIAPIVDETTAPEPQAQAEAIAQAAENIETEHVPETSEDPAAGPQTQKERIAEKLRPTDANEIFGLLGQSQFVLVTEKEIEIGGQPVIFNLRRHSYAKCAYVDAKQYRRAPNGALVHDVAYAETVGVAHQLYETIVRNLNEGKLDEHGQPLEPDWVRFFTLKQLLGEDENSGLMGNSSPEAKELVYKLINAVWEVVPEWNVIAKSAAIEAANSG